MCTTISNVFTTLGAKLAATCFAQWEEVYAVFPVSFSEKIQRDKLASVQFNEANLPLLWQLAYRRLHPERNPSLPSSPVYTTPSWESRILALECADEVPTSQCIEHSMPHGFRQVCGKAGKIRRILDKFVRQNQLTPSMETEAVRTSTVLQIENLYGLPVRVASPVPSFVYEI